MEGNKEALIELAHYKMPFGKYKGEYLVDIPEYYYTWFKQKGFPEGKLGRMMIQMHDIKINGLEELIYTIRRDFSKQKFPNK
ncbi:MAG: hypothetical protein CMO82_13770 [Winogradskyella sp.]|uniref:DUF3820 family protein n=1 Tax=Winogradskyella poriferorum TaxID=307627 RepID=A0ABU7W3T6_9FLAO|nr:hypothetical protein [Winogradskyella sp.]